MQAMHSLTWKDRLAPQDGRVKKRERFKRRLMSLRRRCGMSILVLEEENSFVKGIQPCLLPKL